MTVAKLGTRRWSKFRLRILERDMYRCRFAYPGICLGVATEVDHLVDRALGGPVFDEANCFSACEPCHDEKGRRRQSGGRIGVFYGGRAPEMRPLSGLHTPKNEAGPLLSGDYRRDPATAAGGSR